MRRFLVSGGERYTVIDLHNFLNEKLVCLTLDVEQDFGVLLSKPSYEGLSRIETIVDFLKERGIPLTCFVQGSLFETHSDELKKFFELDDVEFELHSYSHPNLPKGNIEYETKMGIEAYKRFLHKNPAGYRSPNGIINAGDYRILVSSGFKFDSSVFPSIRPGAFYNLSKPISPYLVNDTGIIEFPFTVFSSFFRITVGLSYIKLLGRPYLQLLKASKLPDFIVFGFHLHDLFKLDSSTKIPLSKFSPLYRPIYKRLYQQRKSNGLAIFNDAINILHQKGYKFSKLGDVYNSISGIEQRHRKEKDKHKG